MPKRKRSHRAVSPFAEVKTRNFTANHVDIRNKIDVKIEPASDIEFDPMQSKSMKMILPNAINMTTAIYEPKTKLENDVKIENCFRPELLENSHEVAYISHGNRSHKIVDKITKSKRETKKKLTKRNKWQNAPQSIDPVEIEENVHKKTFKCDYCVARFTILSGNFFDTVFSCLFILIGIFLFYQHVGRTWNLNTTRRKFIVKITE